MSKPIYKVSDDRVVIETLRLSDAEWYDCVSEMDRQSAQQSTTSRARQHERVPYRNSPNIMVETRTYDGRQQYIKVRPYDLSECGIGFLNGAYMHVGTELVLHLRHCDLGMTRVHAKIRTCSHVRGTIHLVGAQFDEPIAINDFLLAEAG